MNVDARNSRRYRKHSLPNSSIGGSGRNSDQLMFLVYPDIMAE